MRDLAFDHWDDLLKMVLEENQRQLEKWGEQDHSPFHWMTFLTEEVGETAQAIGDSHWGRDGKTDGDVALEAIQVATLALKIAEMHLYRRESENRQPFGQICHQCNLENHPSDEDCEKCVDDQEEDR